MKVVINKCFGGFGLSPLAVKRLAELHGRPCFFFKKASAFRGEYIPCSADDAKEEFIWYAFDVPNPNEVLTSSEDWNAMSLQDRQASNALYEQHQLDHGGRDVLRHDPDLVRVVEELGAAASSKYARLSVVEIPDGTDYEIEEYDGREHIAETHRTWA